MAGRGPRHAQLATRTIGTSLPAGTAKAVLAAARLVAGCPKAGMKATVTWQDVGSPTEPGNYQFTDGMITDRADEIAIWQKHPNAMFTVVALPRPGHYGLGAYELPVEDDECE